MQVVASIPETRLAVRTAQRDGMSVGFVPTMGALHAGHLSLVEAARRDHAFVAVSIFVNPTQFAPHEDLSRYPRPLERDLELCREAGVDLVFTPQVADMYPPGACTVVRVSGLTEQWEGAIRPGHFAGVTTVVAKLFQIVPANAAYFGHKDYQQQAVIRQMVRDLDWPIEIHTCPTLRDPDGLAMSSRNVYLSPADRQAGLSLSRAIRLGEAQFLAGEPPLAIGKAMQHLLQSEPGMELDYAVVVDPVTLLELTEPADDVVALLAGRVGSTRLIDNARWTR